MNEIKINKITLDLAGQKVDLSVEQARELKGVLDGLFREKLTYIPANPGICPQPLQPMWSEDSIPANPHWRIDCDSHGRVNCKTIA